MSRSATVLALLAASIALVVGVDYSAIATTGHSLILGKINKANTVTVLRRTTAGPALKVTTTSSSASPLLVNGRGRVANLNADLVDGLDGAALLNRTYVATGSTSAPVGAIRLPLSVPAGKYLVDYSIELSGVFTTGATCAVGMRGASTTVAHSRQSFVDSGMGVALSGSGYLSVSAGSPIDLVCFGGARFDTWEVDSSQPAQLVATRVDTVTQQAATALTDYNP
jgi:hypothetical protein